MPPHAKDGPREIFKIRMSPNERDAVAYIKRRLRLGSEAEAVREAVKFFEETLKRGDPDQDRGIQ